MHYLGLTLPSLAENLALDEALLLGAEETPGQDLLRLWEWPAPAVVLGAAGCLAQEVDEAACAADGVPILRRASGGGTVLLGRGCLLWSVVLAYDRAAELRQIGSSYCYLLNLVCRALDIPGLACAGVSDLAVDGRKVSGNAQQRKREHFLHHGTLLYGFDAATMARYLRLPPRQPDYRQRRQHADFVTNLPRERGDLETRLRQAFAAEDVVSDWPRGLVGELVATKYALPEWTRRR